METTAISLSNTAAVTLPLSQIMPQENVTYGENGITVLQAGDFEINYGLSGSPQDAATINVYVMQNGRTLLPSEQSRSLAAAEVGVFNNSFLASLVAGDILVMQASSSVTTDFSPTSIVNTYLTVKKLSS